MGWCVVVVDIQLSIHIENLYYIVNGVGRRGRGYTTIYTHREPILHSQWGGASWSWIVDIQLSIHIENLYYIVNGVGRRGRGYTTIYTHREPILHSQWGGASWSWIYNYLYT